MLVVWILLHALFRQNIHSVIFSPSKLGCGNQIQKLKYIYMKEFCGQYYKF